MPQRVRERGSALMFGTRIEDLGWIDEFAANVRNYIRVRLEDNVLIKMPLEVHALNPAGARLLQKALRGERIRDIAGGAGAIRHPERIYEMHAFFCDVRDLLSGRMREANGRAATDVRPFVKSPAVLPVLSEIALTYRCNLRCQFCYAGCGGVEPVPAGREMTRGEILRVIDIIAEDGKVPSVSFTGGEPTLHSDLPLFIERARARDMRVNLITNGVLCSSKELVQRLVDAGLHSAQVSIEGATAVIHDGLTQRPGSFDQAIGGIRNMRDAGLRVHTNTTVCRANADSLLGIVDLAKMEGLERLSMNHVIPTQANRAIQIAYSEIGELVLRARDHAEKSGLEFHWYSPSPHCVFNPIAHGLGNKGCAACDGLLHVSPTGEVLPCSSYAESVGNLLSDGFETVWFGGRAKFFRDKRAAPAGCEGCESFALCQGACPLYWQQRGCEELMERRVALGLG